jgi:uncharacterized protein YndB with AHSA1/START domain
MADIRHRVGISASPHDIYEKLATIDGLTEWWTRDVRGEERLGGKLQFFFGGTEPSAVMEVVELEPGRGVVWRCVGGPDEWMGTTIAFELQSPQTEKSGTETSENETVVLFTHGGWRQAGPFLHHCSTKWAQFLLGLKAGFEGGKATPYPEDMAISSWR